MEEGKLINIGGDGKKRAYAKNLYGKEGANGKKKTASSIWPKIKISSAIERKKEPNLFLGRPKGGFEKRTTGTKKVSLKGTFFGGGGGAFLTRSRSSVYHFYLGLEKEILGKPLVGSNKKHEGKNDSPKPPMIK